MNVVPAQVAGVPSLAVASPAAARDRAARTTPCSRPARCSVSTRCMRPEGPRRSRCSPTARRAAPGWMSSPARATSTSRRPSGSCAGSSASMPKPAPPRSRSSPTRPATRVHLAADLISQAEHDPLAACLLVSDSETLLEQWRPRWCARCAAAKHHERMAAALTGQSATVLVRDIEQGIEVVDAWAAEHLEIVTARRRRGRCARPPRRRDLRRTARAGDPRRLPRRVQPRPADRRHRPPHQRPFGRSPSCASNTS